ncbi:serine/threonine-protein kinase PknH/PknJ, partial [Mycobacterium asiaticum]
FGIASATTDEKLTQLGTAVGTWKYMAPERFSNDEVTYRADIYALACVLYECLTGGPPYRADSAGMLVTAHLMTPVPQVSTQRAGIPKAFDTVIARGMAKNPEDRYSSAGDLALAAHEALSDPDQDHAEKIVRRSQEATLPTPPSAGSPPTMAATMAAPQPPPAPASMPQYGPGQSGPLPQQHPSGPPGWGPASGPIPSASQPPPPPQYQGGGWGGGPPGAPVPPQHSGQSWQQGQPTKKRNPWPIVAAVAVVLVLIVGGVGIWIANQPDDKPKKKPISEERLSSLLLSASEINSVMGSATMTPGKAITTVDNTAMTLSIPDCQGAMYTSQGAVYAGSGYTGLHGLVLSEPGDDYDHWVNQATISFPTAAKAEAFMDTSLGKWKNCAGKTVTVTNKGKTYRWTFHEVDGAPPEISVLDVQEGANGWECQRAMAVANNIIIDVNACGYQITDQGHRIADKIVAKVDNED